MLRMGYEQILGAAFHKRWRREQEECDKSLDQVDMEDRTKR